MSPHDASSASMTRWTYSTVISSGTSSMPTVVEVVDDVDDSTEAAAGGSSASPLHPATAPIASPTTTKSARIPTGTDSTKAHETPSTANWAGMDPALAVRIPAQ